MGWIAPAIGLGGSLLTGKSGKQAQKAQSQLAGSETTAIDDLMQQYFGPGGAAQGMSQLLPQLLSWATNPTSNPAMSGINTALGAQGGSTVRTLQGDEGAGTANPAALATRLFGQSNQSAGQYAAEAIPGLQQTALSGAESIFGNESGGLNSGLNATQNLESQYAKTASSASNPFGSLGTLANSLFTGNGPFAGGGNNSGGLNAQPINPNTLAPVGDLPTGSGAGGMYPVTGGGNPFSSSSPYQPQLSGLPPSTG